MQKIAIKREPCSTLFEGEMYEIDTYRPFGGYEKGDLVCYCTPFFGVPLKLYIAIRANGDLIFREWSWNLKNQNTYLHTSEKPNEFIPTQAQCETVNGLWSGRIKFEGLKLDVGETVQDICPINVEQEEQLLNKKIGLA